MASRKQPRLNQACALPAVRDAELVAHTEFRKHLYAYDVVPEARAAADALLSQTARSPGMTGVIFPDRSSSPVRSRA